MKKKINIPLFIYRQHWHKIKAPSNEKYKNKTSKTRNSTKIYINIKDVRERKKKKKWKKLMVASFGFQLRGIIIIWNGHGRIKCTIL